jgi:hypothetical protein
MKSRNLYTAMFLSAILLLPGIRAHAAEPARGPALRIGVFDSRAVAIAYARTPATGARFQKLREDLMKAKAANDTARIKELEQQGQWSQVRLHQQGFSTVGVGAVLATVADQLPGVARDAGVALLVSKWELPYLGKDVETVDVTLPLVKLFKPDEQTLKMIPEIMKAKPVPFDELGLDAND